MTFQRVELTLGEVEALSGKGRLLRQIAESVAIQIPLGSSLSDEIAVKLTVAEAAQACAALKMVATSIDGHEES